MSVIFQSRLYHNWVEKEMPNLSGKVAIVTGSNTGLGFWAANALAYKCCTVVLACRSIHKAKQAKQNIQKRHPYAQVDVLEEPLDNNDLSCVEQFAESFQKKYHRLDYLINNAGVLAQPHTPSKDGHNSQFQTNHLAHFYLTKLLWETMQNTPTQSRVVQHSSVMHFLGSVRFDPERVNDCPEYNAGFLWFHAFVLHVFMPWTGYHHIENWMRYMLTKLCSVLFMKELASRLEDGSKNKKILSLACHPGMCATSMLTTKAHHAFGPLRWVWL